MDTSIANALLFVEERKFKHDDGSRYWGPATGINWCEIDYQVSTSIAEVLKLLCCLCTYYCFLYSFGIL
jgi:hypothetical protein